MCPYIITTTTAASHEPTEDGQLGNYMPARQSRRAVATLDEARELIAAHINGADVPNLHPAVAAYDDLPEQGGTVTLPDGTVIQVERVYYEALLAALPNRGRDLFAYEEPYDEAKIIGAYNAAQEA